jgi:hypothetical protein
LKELIPRKPVLRFGAGAISGFLEKGIIYTVKHKSLEPELFISMRIRRSTTDQMENGLELVDG